MSGMKRHAAYVEADADELTTVACESCDGVIRYRTQFSGFPAESDNFDQFADHRPILFTTPVFLASIASRRAGQVIVWEVEPNDIGGYSPVRVVAFAGHHDGMRIAAALDGDTVGSGLEEFGGSSW